MSIPIHTRELKSRAKRVSLCCNSVARADVVVASNDWCRHDILYVPVTGVISILIESRFAVSNAECPSRHEKLPYFRIDPVTIPRYTTSYGNDTFKTFCYAGLIEGTYLHIFVYARNEKKKNINKLGKYIFLTHLRNIPLRKNLTFHDI